MRDDHEFNVHFVAVVEKYQCLYDSTIDDYSRRDVQDQAWRAIGKELSETSLDCRDRWRNLRAGYSRHLRYTFGKDSKGPKYRRPYYLASHLNFLQPHTKPRPPRQRVSNNITKKRRRRNNRKPINEEPIISNDDDNNGHKSNSEDVKIELSETELIPTATEHDIINEFELDAFAIPDPSTFSEAKTMPNESLPLKSTLEPGFAFEIPAPSEFSKAKAIPNESFPLKSTLENLEPGFAFEIPAPSTFSKAKPNPNASLPLKSTLETKQASNDAENQTDPDLLFFTSILPEVKEMNNDQKRRFKIEILQLIGKYLTGRGTNMVVIHNST